MRGALGSFQLNFECGCKCARQAWPCVRVWRVIEPPSKACTPILTLNVIVITLSFSLALSFCPDYIILSDYSLSLDAQTCWRLQCNITCLYMTCGCYMRYATTRHTTGNIRLVCSPLRPDSFIVINHRQALKHRLPRISMLQQNAVITP